ncbi:heparinase II/III family protein [bacterium]|nr:heparinase II/III family protein [bacterium]
MGFKYPTFENIKSSNLIFEKSIPNYKSYFANNKFKFLNIEKEFDTIDWNYKNYGKLWTYNITYFDFLNQEDISKDEAINLIYNFIENENILKDAIESFPISLRGINWIKFLSKEKIKDENIDTIIYKHYMILLDNLEYHLLGNHLLENGYSLLFAAYYFQDEKLYSKAKEILKLELKEQILDDGAHFELTPMYHQIMFFRLLECINLVKNNTFKNQELLVFLEDIASKMLSWLKNITFKNGEIPLLNDSAFSIAPTSDTLFDYARRLNIKDINLALSQSGYRKIEKESYECIIDIGNIGPDYIPGHAHSDTFNFVVNYENKPFIVDTGLSTYETNQRRTSERNTSAHNTVEINGKDQSEVWGGFRVADRAKIIKIEEEIDIIKASHDGYKKDGITHTRIWNFKEKKLIIKDELSKKANAIARLHFHPNITKENIIEKIICDKEIVFYTYDYAPRFNTLQKAIMIEISFEKNLELEIQL